MDIILVKDVNNSLSKIFSEYDISSKKIFETSGLEQQKYVVLYKELKNQIDGWVLTKLKERDILRFNESEYEDKINNLVARNLLSNGLYSKVDIDEIFTKYKGEIGSKIQEVIYEFYGNDNGKILIWNMSIEG